MSVRKSTPKTDEAVTLTRLTKDYIDIPIVGITPIISHRWSEKARRGMPGHPDKQQIDAKKGVHVPEQEALDNLHRLPDDGTGVLLPNGSRVRPGAPAVSFKAAMIGAVGLFAGLTKVNTRICLHVVGEGPEQLVPVNGHLELHEDIVRTEDKSAMLCYRYYICDWSAVVRVLYVPTLISRDSVASLLDAAGMGGVGDWRPSSPKSYTGTYGQWSVVEALPQEQPVLLPAAAVADGHQEPAGSAVGAS